MPDVVELLHAPAPWESHGAITALPGAMHGLLSRWPGRQADFFCTSGPADDALRSGGFQAPGLVAGDDLAAEHLTPGTLAALQAALMGQAERRHLVITGPIAWDGTLEIAGALGLTLDFNNARILGAPADKPLIRVTGCQKLALRGLRVAGRNLAVLEIAASQDVALTDSALGGSTGAAVRLSGGCRRVLIDASAFVQNAGPAIAIQGDATQVIIARSHFEGATAAAFIEVAATPGGAEGMGPAHPMDIRILENRFARAEDPALRAEACCGLWIERNDFAGLPGGAVAIGGGGLGIHLADNRFPGGAADRQPQVSIRDSGLVCVFRNTFEPLAQAALVLEGRFGGVLIGANTAMIRQDSEAAAFRLSPSGACLATTLMANIIRGPFVSGIRIDGTLPRLFLFDNQIFGTTTWSIQSLTPQPGATSINNLSPVQSLNLPLSETENAPVRMIRALGLRRLLARLVGNDDRQGGMRQN